MSSRGRAEALVRARHVAAREKAGALTGSPPLCGNRTAAAARDLLLAGSPPSRRGSAPNPDRAQQPVVEVGVAARAVR